MDIEACQKLFLELEERRRISQLEAVRNDRAALDSSPERGRMRGLIRHHQCARKEGEFLSLVEQPHWLINRFRAIGTDE